MADFSTQGKKRVKVIILGEVPSVHRNTQVSCLMVLQLLSYMSSRRRKKTHGQTVVNLIVT